MKTNSTAVILTGVMAITIAAYSSQAMDLGDRAPKLDVQATLKGAKAPQDFASGKVYVIEFWATWCPACVNNIPHLAELQNTFKDKGVQVIALTSDDDATVRQFLKGKGSNMEYTVAIDSGKTWDAYAKPFGVDSIPHAFVVDQHGKLVWHGHPQEGLDEVIEKVVAGTYDVAIARKIANEAQAKEEDNQIMEVWAIEYMLLSKTGRYAELTSQVEQRIKDRAKGFPSVATKLVSTLLDDAETNSHLNVQFLLDIAKAAVEATNSKDAEALSALAKAEFKAGQVKQAVSTQQTAISMAAVDDKEEYENVLKTYQE